MRETVDPAILSRLALAYASASGDPGARLAEALRAEAVNMAEHGREVAAFIDTIKAPVPPEILEDYRRSSAAALREAEALAVNERARDRLEKIREDLARVEENIERGADLAHPDFSRKVEEIARGVVEILPESNKAHKLTPANRHDFGACTGYPIAFWNGLRIPSPGATLIGAKTGAGKTTALVNIARELLAQGRRVAFISYEANAQELGLALALSMMAHAKTEPIAGFTPTSEGSGLRFTEPDDHLVVNAADLVAEDYFSRVKAYISENGVPHYLAEADAQLCAYLETESLAIIDGMGDADAMAAFIARSTFDAYLLDYVQIVKPAQGAPTDSYRRVADVIDRLRPLVNAGKKCLIMGAQFNRGAGEVDAKANPAYYDPSAEQFREAGDIEQVATLAVGIGRMKDSKGEARYFWKVLKHRYNGQIRDARMLSEENRGLPSKYHYLRRGSPWYTGSAWEPIKDRFTAPPVASPRKPRKDENEETNGRPAKAPEGRTIL